MERIADCKQAQTPQQRKANDKFKKAQDAKRGKPASEIKKKEEFKSPISPIWLGRSILSRGGGRKCPRNKEMDMGGQRMWIERGLIGLCRYPWICGLRRSDIRVAEPDLPPVRRCSHGIHSRTGEHE